MGGKGRPPRRNRISLSQFQSWLGENGFTQVRTSKDAHAVYKHSTGEQITVPLGKREAHFWSVRKAAKIVGVDWHKIS